MLKRKIKLIALSAFAIFIITNCSNSLSTPIKIIYSKTDWNSIDNIKTIYVTGKINKEDWKRYQNETEVWVGELKNLTIICELSSNNNSSGESNKKITYPSFFKRRNGEICLQLKPESEQESGDDIPLRIIVNGFQTKPDDLIFRHNLENISSQDTSEEVVIDDFDVNGEKPEEITSSLQNDEQDYIHISLIFDSNRDQIKQYNYEISREIGIAFNNSLLGLYFIDQDNTIKATSVWRYPYESKENMEDIEFEAVGLKTPFGDWMCQREDLQRDNEISISDFFKKKLIESEKKNELIYYRYLNQNKEQARFGVFWEQEGKTIEPIYLNIPKIKYNENIKWMLTVVDKLSSELIEPRIFVKEIMPTDDKISVNFNTPSRLQIKTVPADTLVTVQTKINEIVFISKTNENGLLELPSNIRPYEEKIITVERQGYFSKQMFSCSFEKDGQEMQNQGVEDQDDIPSFPEEYDTCKYDLSKTYDIELEKVNMHLKKNKIINKNIYESVGGDYQNLQISGFDKVNIPIMQGLLRHFEFIPENVMNYKLTDSKFIYNHNNMVQINRSGMEIEIDVKPDEKRMRVNFNFNYNGSTLRDQTDVKFKENYSGAQLRNLEFSGNSHFIDGVQFLCNQNGSIQSKICTLCYPGYQSKKYTMSIDTSQYSDDQIDYTVQIQPINPEVIILISGNAYSTGEYWFTAQGAVSNFITICNDMHNRPNVRVFVTSQGNLKPIDNAGELNKYDPRDRETDLYIEEEVRKAQSFLSNDDVYDICKNQLKYIVYIAKVSEIVQKVSNIEELHIISPDSPNEVVWGARWHSAVAEEQIINNLKLICNITD